MSRSALEANFARWKFTLLFSSLLGGICLLVGTTLGLLSLLGLLTNYPMLDNFGTAMLAVGFPLLVLAAHSLDKAHDAETATRIEYCKRTGMINEEEK